jgi:hypothetical protein
MIGSLGQQLSGKVQLAYERGGFSGCAAQLSDSEDLIGQQRRSGRMAAHVLDDLENDAARLPTT